MLIQRLRPEVWLAAEAVAEALLEWCTLSAKEARQVLRAALDAEDQRRDAEDQRRASWHWACTGS